jgi:hypothetical protein
MWPSHSFFPHPILEKKKGPSTTIPTKEKEKEPKPLMCTQKLDERK